MCFKERLERSHSFVLARAERALLSITTAAAGSGQQASTSAAAAVAAAVQTLPLEQLDSINWRGMRFNDDLTTRLPWLPPIQGPRQLVVLLWWEQQQQGMGRDSGSSGGSSSSAACWWRQVSAAEADIPAAATLRGVMKAAVQQRWLLPHLLHASLDACSSNSTQQQQLPQLLQRLAVAQGYGSAAELDQAVQDAFGDGVQAGSSGQLLSQQLQLLDAALFTLAHSLQVRHRLPEGWGCSYNLDVNVASIHISTRLTLATLQALGAGNRCAPHLGLSQPQSGQLPNAVPPHRLQSAISQMPWHLHASKLFAGCHWRLTSHMLPLFCLRPKAHIPFNHTHIRVCSCCRSTWLLPRSPMQLTATWHQQQQVHQQMCPAVLPGCQLVCPACSSTSSSSCSRQLPTRAVYCRAM